MNRGLLGAWRSQDSWLGFIFQDWSVNDHRAKFRVGLCIFRLAQMLRAPYDEPPSFLSRTVSVVYLGYCNCFLGIELPVKTRVGRRLRIVHGFGLVVNVDSCIGSDVLLRHGVTIGNKGTGGPSPTIGDGVEVGAGAVILGGVSVGSRAIVGANSVVLNDVPDGQCVVGNPARPV